MIPTIHMRHRNPHLMPPVPPHRVIPMLYRLPGTQHPRQVRSALHGPQLRRLALVFGAGVVVRGCGGRGEGWPSLVAFADVCGLGGGDGAGAWGRRAGSGPGFCGRHGFFRQEEGASQSVVFMALLQYGSALLLSHSSHLFRIADLTQGRSWQTALAAVGRQNAGALLGSSPVLLGELILMTSDRNCMYPSKTSNLESLR